MRRPLEAWDSGTDSLAAPETTWAQGSSTRVLGDCLFQLAWSSPLVCGSGPSSGLGQHHLLHPHPSSWTLRTRASSVQTPSLAWCTAMSYPWIQPSWTCWWPWPKAMSGARSATRSWWTWSVLKWVGNRGGGAPGLGPHSAWLELGGQVAPPSLPSPWTKGFKPCEELGRLGGHGGRGGSTMSHA